jgi:hypothetical protein
MHVAAGDHGGVGTQVLAPEGPGHGLVDQGKALGLAPDGDQRHPEVAEGAQLQVDVARRPGQLQHPPVQLVGAAGVGLQVAAQQPQPAPQRVRVEPAGHPLGPGQPAAATAWLSKFDAQVMQRKAAVAAAPAASPARRKPA